MIEFYLPLVWNLVPMVTSVGLAVAATLVAREIFARRTREKQYRALGIMEDPFVSDHAVSRILDKREAVAREACEKSAAEEAERLTCELCAVDYRASEGHECPPPPEPAPRVVPIPPIGAIVARPVKEPLFDRAYIPPTVAPQAPPPIVKQGQADVYSSKTSVNPHYRYTLSINIPVCSSEEFRVTGLSLWTPADSAALTHDVRVFTEHDNRVRNIPGQIIWSKNGKMNLDAPIVLPRGSRIQFDFINLLPDNIDVTAAIHGVWYSVEQPLTPTVSYGPTNVSWFVTGAGQLDPNDPGLTYKTIADTTTYGSCPMPNGYHFYWYKFQVEPEEGADPDDVRELKNRGAFEFLLGHSRYRTFLGSEALTVGEGVDVTVSGKPVELAALEYFKVQLSTHGMKIKKGLWCRVILKGIKLRALCA